MSIFNQILERSKLNKELIGLWKYRDDSKFWCGFILDYNETLVKMISNIQSVDFNDDYAKAMQVVIDYSTELEKEEKIDIAISDDNHWDYEVLKQMEGNLDIITSVEINNSDYYSGFIMEVSETDFILKCIGKLGQDEGLVAYKIEDVTGFRINDIDNRKRSMLHKWRKTIV
jgi:hypothetical protein